MNSILTCVSHWGLIRGEKMIPDILGFKSGSQLINFILLDF